MTSRPEDLFQQAAKLHRQGQRAEAIAMFRQVLAAHPDASEGWYELGYLLKAERQYEEALEAYAQALAHQVSRPEEVHLNRAVIYSDHLRRDEDAERELNQALALAPDYTPALLNLGNLHEERGSRTQSLACYNTVLAGIDRPDHPYRDLCFEALARSAKLRPPSTPEDPMFARLEQAASLAFSKMVRANLLFALGEARDRLQQYDLAFEAFAKANRWLLRQAGRTYNRDRYARTTDTLITSFADVPSNLAESTPVPGAQPLFICGMFRSGSTLVEQVLAAHPQVTAGGELNYLRQLAAVQLAPFPESMATPDPVRDGQLAQEYLAHLASLFPDGIGGSYITDKRPDNFLLIGLIKRLFPAARIVHTVRNPLDNGLSIFSHHLQPNVAPYSTDLGDIGHYYGQYRRLMSHWKTLFPDSIFDFDYDAFVLDPKPALEGLLQFLGLPWDDRCLEFHRLRNTVKTASYWQIRQPLHTNASGRWRNYGPHLEPMRQTLADSGLIARDAS